MVICTIPMFALLQEARQIVRESRPADYPHPPHVPSSDEEETEGEGDNEVEEEDEQEVDENDPPATLTVDAARIPKGVTHE